MQMGKFWVLQVVGSNPAAPTSFIKFAPFLRFDRNLLDQATTAIAASER